MGPGFESLEAVSYTHLAVYKRQAILHVAAEQPGQHHTDLRLALAAVALDDHHALALIAGNQAVADELLHLSLIHI